MREKDEIGKDTIKSLGLMESEMEGWNTDECMVLFGGGWFNHPEFNFPVRRFVWYSSGQIMHRIKRPELHAFFFLKVTTSARNLFTISVS